MREEGKNYQVTYGLLRIVACFSVVFHHFISSNQQYINTLETQWLIVAVDHLLMCNNGLFFMLSGKFALEYYDGRIGHFYKNKLLKIGLPFLLVSIYFYFFGGVVPAGEHSLWGFVEAFMASEILGYLWFVYSLIGFYIVVPFIAPMMKAMDLKEKKWFALLLVVAIFLRNVCRVFALPFMFGGFPFYHSAYILLGYLIDNIDLSKCKEYLIYALAVPAAIISGFFVVYKPGMNPDVNDYCLSRILMCSALFIFISRRTQGFSLSLQKPIKWIGDQTYYVYLLHILAQTFFLSQLWDVWVLLVKLPFLLALFWGSVIIFGISLPLAFMCRKCLDFLVVGIRKIGTVRR